ncbi:lysophospholipid acyltransferase family protein [Haloechinothrix sp. LS1_15]|uniref:lysophospholipid acyltransferase family protein n=1 Tax=Haloechinothrix sp. LS1_15 TaxID=2652248 RepID=UPI00294AD859|nr:lysophospholipid acyltransferase family protein [Haloechinothrix sp. LS1_15]
MRRVTAWWRLALAAGAALVALLCVPALGLVGQVGRLRFQRSFFVVLAAALGVRVAAVGGDDLAGRVEPRPGQGALLVSNHVSWLDVVAVNTVAPVRCLAKAEIAGWPVIGPLASAAGTVFVDRAALSRLPGTVFELSRALREGWLVAVFGEGTTRCGKQVGRFHNAPFQAALEADAVVRPVTVRYRLAGAGETTHPAMIAGDSLLDCARRIARLSGLIVEVRIGEPIAPSRAGDRRLLAAFAETAVRGTLREARVRVRETSR